MLSASFIRPASWRRNASSGSQLLNSGETISKRSFQRRPFVRW